MGDDEGEGEVRAPVWTQEDTEVSALQRKKRSGAALVDKRVNVVGRGIGTVVGMKKAFGRKTRHVIRFEPSGRTENLLLRKQPGARAGVPFYVQVDE